MIAQGKIIPGSPILKVLQCVYIKPWCVLSSQFIDLFCLFLLLVDIERRGALPAENK
jgi:hypothetical protein